MLARRAAEAQPELREALAGLQDGMGLAASSMRDLLSAQLTEGGMPIVAAARATAEAMQAAGVARPGDLQAAAAGWVESHLHARAVFVHGFADATGQAAALLRALLARGARMVIDLPSDPAAADRPDRGQSFVLDFVERLAGSEARAVAQQAWAASPQQDAPQLSQMHAAGAEDETRELAQRIRALLAEGVPAEEIGVVARTLPPYAVPLRRWFGELGIPFRGGAAPAALFPVHRRFQAVLAVLREGEDCPVDRWLDAVAEGSHSGALDPQRIADLRLAFRALGLGRLGQLDRFDEASALGERAAFPLPIRRGLVEVEPGEEGEADAAPEVDQPQLAFEQQYRAHRRSIPAGAFLQAFGAARGLVRAWRRLPARASLAEHALAVEKLLKSELGWRAEAFDREDNWLDLVRGLGEIDLGPCSRGEYLLMLEREARHFGARPLGGSAGVAVLDLTQARARTFQHLFVLGLNRGVFPRVVQADPILPDRARAALRVEAGNQDLQLAERGHAEERYLFAQLCSAAPQVHLSWLRADEDGKELPPSPFLQRLWLSPRCALEEGGDGTLAVPRLRAELLARPQQARTGAEALILAGLREDRAAWRALLPAVLPGGPALAAARAELLDEYEPDRRTPEGRERAASFGPWSGLLPESLADSSTLFVTRLEAYARCGWQSFLNHALHLEAAPDPLADLPDIDPALLGSAVHGALETLLAGPEAAQGKPRKVGHPSELDQREHTLRAARQVAYAEDLRVPGLITALAMRAQPLVARALELEFAETSALHVIGCEEKAELEVKLPDGGVRRLAFLADRVDRGPDGAPVYIDYKTSRPPWKQKGAAKRAEKLAEAVLRGERLQVAAYAASQEGAAGRYLFLRRLAEAPEAAYSVGLQHDAPVIESFRTVAGELMAAREAGWAFARMETPDGKRPKACEWCELAEACLRHDSGARRRLVAQLDQSDDGLFELWTLPERKLEDEA